MDKKYNKFIVFGLLFIIFGLAVFFRVFFVYNTVYSDPIKYSADDGVYHMRLVENTLLGGHFPNVIYFDPFTYFPHGTYIHFTPLFDWLLCLVIWVISFGKPTLKIINLIAPFYPVFLGSLLVFVVYFLAKAFWKDNKIALFSAFLSAISTPFLSRSLAGMTDHHVAEVLFSTLTMLFLVLALQARKEKITQNKKLSASNLWLEIKHEKKFWLCAFLTGFSLGLYFLAWTGALMFLFLIFLFIVIYYLIEYFLGNRKNWILWMGTFMFLVSFLMIAPLLGHPNIFQSPMYNIEHIAAFFLGILVFVILMLLDVFFVKKKISPKLLPVFLIFSGLFLLVLLKIFFPVLFSQLLYGVKEVNIGMADNQNPLARELIQEMAPLGFAGFVQNFSSIFFISIVSLVIIFYQFLKSIRLRKQGKPEYLLLIIWTVFMMLMTGLIPAFGQNRFSCYLAPVFSLLTGFLLIKGLQFGWLGVKKSEEDVKTDNPIKIHLLVGSFAIICLVLFFLLYPAPFNLGYSFPYSLPDFVSIPLGTAKGLFTFNSDAYDVMSWLKNNTPDPGLDYYGSYKEPGINKQTGKIEDYSYPKQAYGILAEWDIGHIITYYGHRIPIANPFTEGIGRKDVNGKIVPGYATFFLEGDESKAAGYLDELKARYIISDSSEANSNSGFQYMIKWVQGNFNGYLIKGTNNIDMNKFLNSMIARLHLFNGSEATSAAGSKQEVFIGSLDHFRILYESKTTAYSMKDGVENDVKEYKVFEYVKGAEIKGATIPGANVEISTNVKTNQGNDFIYKKTIKSEDGSFDFIVPYSTGKQENSDVSADSYKIKTAGREFTVKVSEESVTSGKIITVY